jgi:tetratricopeptide (TPR) repeat protein
MPKRANANEQLEFEIAFYERLLRDKPDFTEALIALGEAYTRRGWYEKGLTVDLKLTQLQATNPTAWYNLACSYSLLKRPDEAFEALRRAFALGYDDAEYLIKDPDLATLRQSPRFRGLLEQCLASRRAGPQGR